MRMMHISLWVMLISAATALGEPATQPVEPQAVPPGNFLFTPPAGWDSAGKKADMIGFITPAHDAKMVMQVLPTDAEVSLHSAGVIIKSCRDQKPPKCKVLIDPHNEPDVRFILKIHEKYEVTTDKGVKTIEQLHIYRQVGPRCVMMTISTSDDDAAKRTADLTAAEDVVASVYPKGQKPPKPAAKPATPPAPTTRPPPIPKPAPAQ